MMRSMRLGPTLWGGVTSSLNVHHLSAATRLDPPLCLCSQALVLNQTQQPPRGWKAESDALRRTLPAAPILADIGTRKTMLDLWAHIAPKEVWRICWGVG